MVCVERELENLERGILRSKAWNMMMQDVDIGVIHPKKPKFRPVRIVHLYRDRRGLFPLAMATHDEILFHDDSFLMMSNTLALKIMMHELIHLYLADNGKDHNHYNDGTELFERCARYLKVNVDIHLLIMWRLPGKKWRH